MGLFVVGFLCGVVATFLLLFITDTIEFETTYSFEDKDQDGN